MNPGADKVTSVEGQFGLPGECDLVSVVMPAYNCRRFVKKAVASVLQQSYANFEFLIYDDGSTDGTDTILRELADRDRRIILFKREHQGYSPLLNEGLRQARGEFIARMDADDISAPCRFAKQIDFLRSNPNCVAVGSGLIAIDQDDNPFARSGIETEHAQIDARHLKGLGGTMPHPSLMIRKSALAAIGGYRTRYEPAEDLDMLLRLGERGCLANIPEYLLKYRIHSQMTSVQRRERQVAAHHQILTDAHERRGMPLGAVLPPMLRRQGDDSAKRRSRRAFHSGYYSTAQKYALRAWLEHPLRLAECVWLLRMSYVRVRKGDHGDPVWSNSKDDRNL